MSALLNRFWAWYERRYRLNLAVASGLFVLQLLHLSWLTLHVVAHRLLSESYFPVSTFWQFALIAVDYTEIPALISTSLVYVYDLRQRFRWKAVFFLLFLNSQWLHIFWITDEFLLSQLLRETQETFFPLWLAWVAILIDYLELPVIVDMLRRLFVSFNAQSFREITQKASKYYIWRQ